MDETYQEEDDGYNDIFPKRSLHPIRDALRKAPKFILRLPLSTASLLSEFAHNTLLPTPPKKEIGTLILIRHGESMWNSNKTFTGWRDPDLSPRGMREVTHAARLLLEGGFDLDVIYTSRLQRAVRSVWMLVKELDLIYLPVFKSWRLNERHYGALQGLSKVEITKVMGEEIVAKWRGGLKDRPPPCDITSENYPGNPNFKENRAFNDLRPEQLPRAESLLDCMTRSEPLWRNRIKQDLIQGRNVCVVAHGNSLRGLVKLIDNIDDKNIEMIAIPTSIRE